MADKILRAGASVIDITPVIGGSIVGYMNDRRSVRIHDPLQVRCLVLDNGEQEVAFAVCDLIAIAQAQVEAARHLIHSHTGIPLHNILICATHTHSGATSVGIFQSEPDAAYLEWVVKRIAEGVRNAAAHLRPARIGWASAREPSLVFNRRFHMKPGTIPPNPFGGVDQVQMNPGHLNPNILKPAGPIDPELSLLAVQTAEGEPLALLGSYALHYVGNNPGTDISADYFAMWSEEVSRLLGECCSGDDRRPRFVPMLANACSGDINNIDVSRPFEQAYEYAHMRRMARKLAESAASAWKTVEFQPWVPLHVNGASLTLRIRRPDPADVEAAKAALSAAGPDLNTLAEVYARETVLLTERPDRVEIPMQAIRIGDLGIATFPGEAFVELGLDVKQKSPFGRTMCIELANDYAGYIPTRRAFDLGGYETWRARSSCLEVNSGDVMIETAARLLNELHRS
jgi:hypothetical protein